MCAHHWSGLNQTTNQEKMQSITERLQTIREDRVYDGLVSLFRPS